MPTFSFHAGETSTINDLAGSGLGFYGGGFGTSVAVGSFQDRTFITNANGTAEGPEADNVKWTHNSSGLLGQAGVSLLLQNIPNERATLNIRFTHATAVKTQNGEVRIYDRSSIANPPSGLQCRVAELIHPDPVQQAGGSGDTTWIWASGDNPTVPIVSSPGQSGESPSSSNTTEMRHDWFLAISASPDSIGSKTQFALYVSIEYL